METQQLNSSGSLMGELFGKIISKSELNPEQLKSLYIETAIALKKDHKDPNIYFPLMDLPYLEYVSIEEINHYTENYGEIKKENNRFKLGSALNAFEPRPPIKFIIEGVIKEKSLNSWFGKYGHKKTFAALSAGVCVAAGTPWIGINTTQCPVLFIDEESGEYSLLDRLEAAIKGESQNKNIPFYYLSLSAFNFFNNDTDLDILRDFIVQIGAKLIFIDAFDDVMAGSDENSVKDNQPVLIRLRKICEDTDSAIVVLHHTNAKMGMRGSTSIPGSLNSALKIESENGSSTIKFSTEKMRDSKTFSKDAKIVYVDKKDDPTQLELFYLREDDTPFDEKINIREKTILDYMKANNNDLIITEYLKTVSNEEKGAYRASIYDLRDKKIIEKNEEKSEHNKAVLSIVA
jgi:RecA-family ATPase